MRRRAFTIDEELTVGLQTDSRLRRRNRALSALVNLRPFSIGLTSLPRRTNPFPLKTVKWPFPQLFQGREHTLLLDETAISFVDETVDPFIETPIVTFDSDNPALAKAIPAGGVWHMMDFADTFMFFNGEATVYHTNIDAVNSAEEDKVLVQDTITVNTGCAFRGRGIFGGFDPTDFWSDAWDQIWIDLSGGETDINRDQPLGTNFVWWTSIGGGDLLWIFRPDLAQVGITGKGFSVDDPLLLDELKRNQMGFMPMPWQGTVLRCLPLGNAIIIYGTGGISALVPRTVGSTATFGLLNLRDHGIAGRGAAGGSERGHVFVDDAGFLWAVNPELRLERLGYREFFKPMLDTPGEIAIHEDPIENDIYISDGERTFVLTESGLGEVTSAPTGFIDQGGELFALSVQEGGRDWLFRTNALDFGSRDFKVIHTIEVAATNVSMMQVMVEQRARTGEDFEPITSWITVSDTGNAFLRAGGVELRVSVRGTLELDDQADLEAKIDSVNVGWGLMGRRFTAGPIFQGDRETI